MAKGLELEKDRERGRECAPSKRAECGMAGIYYVPVDGRGRRSNEEASVTQWWNKNLALRQAEWCKSQN